MKYLVLVAIVLAVIWFIRLNRPGGPAKGERAPPKTGPEALPPPQDMVRCPVCSLHLPRTDALPGKDGRLYCCAEHRVRAGD